MITKNTPIGTHVWHINNWSDRSDNIVESIIEEYTTTTVQNQDVDIVKLHGVTLIGHMGATLYNVWLSENEAREAQVAKNETILQSYKSSIIDTNSLLQFALTHCIGSAAEYTDGTARKAYIERANELGFTISD